jgi:cold shock CspA family protein/ribosome-associated translation inhibitor RaiA
MKTSVPVGDAEAPVATPVEIVYENMEATPEAEKQVLRGLDRLERVAPALMGVRVTLARRNLRHRTGDLYEARLELTLPGPDVAVSRTPPRHSESEDLAVAIGEAFDKARRELIEWHDRVRGKVKAHEPTAHGRVTDLFPDHGFIRGADGRIVYFHRNSVAGEGWAALEPGCEVRFSEEQGEQGPQASSVTISGPPA